MNIFKLSRAGASLMEDFDRHVGELIHTLASPPRTGDASGIGVFENDNSYRIEVEVPGVAREDIEVELLDQKLTIRGHRPEPLSGQEDATLHRSESRYGKLERTVPLAKDAASEGIDAELLNGVLVITVPKLEAARKRTIAVRNGR